MSCSYAVIPRFRAGTPADDQIVIILRLTVMKFSRCQNGCSEGVLVWMSWEVSVKECDASVQDTTCQMLVSQTVPTRKSASSLHPGCKTS